MVALYKSKKVGAGITCVTYAKASLLSSQVRLNRSKESFGSPVWFIVEIEPPNEGVGRCGWWADNTVIALHTAVLESGHLRVNVRHQVPESLR